MLNTQTKLNAQTKLNTQTNQASHFPAIITGDNPFPKLTARKLATPKPSLGKHNIGSTASAYELKTDKTEALQDIAQHGVTELVLSARQHHSHNLILPMLAYLSHQNIDQWVTWVAPVGINKQLLQSYQVDTKKIRLVHVGNNEDKLWITWDALATGNSHTVIADLGLLSSNKIKQLEMAARRGNCQGLLLSTRP